PTRSTSPPAPRSPPSSPPRTRRPQRSPPPHRGSPRPASCSSPAWARASPREYEAVLTIESISREFTTEPRRHGEGGFENLETFFLTSVSPCLRGEILSSVSARAALGVRASSARTDCLTEHLHQKHQPLAGRRAVLQANLAHLRDGECHRGR